METQALVLFSIKQLKFGPDVDVHVLDSKSYVSYNATITIIGNLERYFSVKTRYQNTIIF